MANFCRHCGAKLNPGEKFCPNCGQPVSPAAQNHTASDPGSKRQDPYLSSVPPKTGRGPDMTGLLNIILAAVLLVEAVLVCFWHPGFLKKEETPVFADQEYILPDLTEEDLAAVRMTGEPAGVSSIHFDSDAVQPETAKVSGENTLARFDCGVSLSFGDFCLYDEPHQVEVRALGIQSDDQFEAVGYDLLLDGQEAEFDGLVQVTLPCDPDWGDDVFVQYWNEQTGSWEILYAEPNGNGAVTFWTDHFCTFAEFREKVEKGKGSSSRPIFRERQGNSPTELWVDLNWDSLAAQVREGKLSAQARLADLTGGSDYVALGINTLGSVHSGLEFAESLKLLPECSEKILGPLGQTITVSKFLYQGHSESWSKAWKNNRADLAILVVGSGTTLPPPVGTTCLTIAAGYSLYSTTEAVVKSIGDGSYWASDAEKAYRKYTKNYLIYNRRNGLVGARYVKNAIEDANTPYAEGYFPLPCGASDADNAQWLNVFEDAMARELRGKTNAMDYVERVIDQVTTAFWKLPKRVREKRARDMGYSDYKEPDTETRDELTKEFKKELCGWLKPYFENQMEKQYQANLNAVYTQYISLSKSLNTRYAIQARYEDKEYLTDTPFYGHPMGLTESERAYPAIALDPIYGNVSFTGAYWLKMGAPTLFRAVGSKKSVFDDKSSLMLREIRLKPGLNTVGLVMPEDPPEPESTEEPKTKDDITPFLGQYEHDGVTFQDGARVTLRMIIKEDYIRLPNNGVNQLFYDSYEVDGNTLTLHFREVEWDYIITLRNRNQMILQKSDINDKQVWLRVPAGQEWEEWGEIYDH